MSKGIVTSILVILDISPTLPKFHIDFFFKYRMNAMLVCVFAEE